MNIETLNLSAYKGSTWNGFSMSITLNGEPLDMTGASFGMELRKEAGSSTVALALSSSDNSIESTSISSFRVNPRIINIMACNYDYDFKIILPDETVLYPFRGTFEIIQNVTR
jgi:hypothetical protein